MQIDKCGRASGSGDVRTRAGTHARTHARKLPAEDVERWTQNTGPVGHTVSTLTHANTRAGLASSTLTLKKLIVMFLK